MIAAEHVEQDPVASAMDGQKQACALIVELRQGCALPDALHSALQALRATGDGDRLRAFSRTLQKALEASQC